ncbi:hypothetical protein [Acholeplasma hippikon]|uniref:Uncharacterized protein n=1 Tax=Acholeplasma hippikon TaxID=264636 RepID=A0A449BIV9_9MOLU|nr:hypothetical protein [Acholeplasma hippikon]VEU82395.1 Uncharacterised protein [Acholeplasma hippikon]
MKFLLGFISFLGFIALLGSGAYLGYGLITEKVQNKMEEQKEVLLSELSIIEQALVSDVVIDELYYAKNFKDVVIKVTFEKTLIEEEVFYSASISNLDEYTELTDFDSTKYHNFSRVLTDNPGEVKGNAITFLIISLSTWLGFWILKKLA